ncbi:MAG: NMD protein affecting ribosome stability and mRNA decay [Methanobacterium sp.]|uniref:60S ribosomal export protein NMD3 n=1 Tax=Methanobacterium sp. TaxID=2164 RepID=UPI003D65CD37|nr:NMD protein affecting ribosome stability and mRNA decay [Methanobacterium sp.]
MFCPKCGKTDEKIFDGVCKSCFLKEVVLAEIPSELEITVCAHCQSRLVSGRWHELELSDKEIMLNTLNKHINLSEYVENAEIGAETILARGSNIDCIVHVKGDVLGEIVEQEYKINFKIKRMVCPECSKFQSGYFEAVIQLRADKRIPDDDEIAVVDGIIADNINKISKKNKMAYISERAVLKEGIDYYVGTYKVAKRLSNTIKDSVGGVVKESPRLMGRDKSAGKDLYRIWISVRLPYFRFHDFIKYENVPGQIMGIDGKKVLIKDLISRKYISVQWRDYDKIETVAKKEDVKETTVTSKTPNSIQILHPVSYEPIDLEINSETEDIEIGMQIHVIEIDENIYILKNTCN